MTCIAKVETSSVIHRQHLVVRYVISMELSEKSELTLSHTVESFTLTVAATAVLKYVFRDKDIQVTRSRNSEIINTADIVYIKRRGLRPRTRAL